MEQWSNELSSPRTNTPIVINSTEMSDNNTQELINTSSIASRGPQVITIDSHSNGPTMPYGFGRQLPNLLPSMNDLNLPPNPFNILAIGAVANPAAGGHYRNYSPQSPEPSEPSPISTPRMNVSTIEGWHTRHTTLYDNTFFSDDEPWRIHFLTQVLPHRCHPES